MTPTKAVKQLLAHGYSQTTLAEAVKANQATISRIAAGKTPKWALGLRLIQLAERKTRK